MKILYRYFLIIGIIISYITFTVNSALARKKNHNLFTVVDVIVEAPIMINNDSLEFNMSINDINTASKIETDYYTFKITGHKTRLIIPLSTFLNYGRISLMDNRLEALRDINHANNLFIFQSGDTVELHLTNKKNQAYFLGKDADKYNCMYRIGNNNHPNNIKKFNLFLKDKNYESAYNYCKYQRDSLYNVQLNILDNYKTKLSTKVFQLIKIDCWSQNNQRVIDQCSVPFMIEGQADFRDAAKKIFFKYYSSYNTSPSDNDSLLLKSYNYCDFLIAKEVAFARLSKTENPKNDDVNFKKINDEINSHYRVGIIKDKIKLLAFLNIDRSKQGDFINCIDEAIDEAKVGRIQFALSQIKNANELGANAYPFKFPDKDGKEISLNNFKGKLIIIDFWFTGCHGCLGMAEALKPIIESYKSNPHIAFVSISIDRDKNLWIKSLKEEMYSSKYEINLLEGMNGHSSFVKNYNIDSYPTLLIISKQGKIITTSPPDPRTDKTSFIDFLTQHL
ncbi:TlpA family protein disulfide reductase [Mucilaginibacter sp. HC2]|uniref:TlpA family protein disulfide reductase n=1 Tax=Mucilaginibacter inviolabilis TaxID=2714892 RepID=UPI00140A8112|nr:TlpA disulfide reductase family protein [Mucilaginibacter inviolabilis]NHA02505.1 TlpA family protein disulfide reductase [Mucilaginibacter inviolabilis]